MPNSDFFESNNNPLNKSSTFQNHDQNDGITNKGQETKRAQYY